MGTLYYLELLVLSVLGTLVHFGLLAIFFKGDRQMLKELLTENVWSLLLVMGVCFLTLVIFSHVKGPINF